MDVVVGEEPWMKEPFRVVCVNEEGLASGGREGAIFGSNKCGRVTRTCGLRGMSEKEEKDVDAFYKRHNKYIGKLF